VSSLRQLSLLDLECPPTPRRAARRLPVDLAGVIDAMVQLLPGFACANAAECGSVAPAWNPERAIVQGLREPGVWLLCSGCLGAADRGWPVQDVPAPRLVRRDGMDPLYGWDPETGELIAGGDMWAEVEDFDPSLAGSERYRPWGQPRRVLLSWGGAQRWRP
jgi:hypothetical protein